MSKKKDGGPAFPRSFSFASNSTWVSGKLPDQEGMSLWQWYKGQALASGMCPHNYHSLDAIDKWCGELADVMIKKREK